MIRYVKKNDEGQILSLMELVKDDFAGYKEMEFLEAVYNAISNDEAIIRTGKLEQEDWEVRKNVLTDCFICLLLEAQKNGDQKQFQKLYASAKRRKHVDVESIKKALEQSA